MPDEYEHLRESADNFDCACGGLAKQMREHTPFWCSILTTEELNEVINDDPSPIPQVRRLTFTPENDPHIMVVKK